jgi:hypothetical protein
MTPAIEDALIDLLLQRLETTANAAAMVDWATDALVAGADTPALGILAGLDRNTSVFEAAPWLDKSLAELKVPPPSPVQLRRAFVGAVSRALMAGKITSDAALDRIHQHAVTPLGHPHDLAAWCYVWERLAPTDFRELTPADVDREARELAAKWARQPGLMAPASQTDGA